MNTECSEQGKRGETQVSNRLKINALKVCQSLFQRVFIFHYKVVCFEFFPKYIICKFEVYFKF